MSGAAVLAGGPTNPVGLALTAAALGTQLITAILGDPVAIRQKAIATYIAHNQDALPSSITKNLDISGATSNIDALTNGSHANPSIVHIHVNALDTQSILDHSDALASAVKIAMNNNHSILDNVRREVAA